MLEKEHISISEMGNLFRCEKQFEFRYIERLPALYSWKFNFYAGKKVETIVKTELLRKLPELEFKGTVESEVKAMLTKSGFVALTDEKILNILPILEKRLETLAQMILEAMPGFVPGGKLITPYQENEKGQIIVLEGYPDFVRPTTSEVIELKVSNKAPSLYDLVEDAIQLESYRGVLGYPSENARLFYGLISQAAKPKSEEVRLLTYSLADIQKKVQFNFTDELKLLLDRLMVLRYSKKFERTGILKGACGFCSFKHLCFKPEALTKTGDEE